MDLNTMIVGIYFLFLIAIGWMFRHLPIPPVTTSEGEVVCFGGW